MRCICITDIKIKGDVVEIKGDVTNIYLVKKQKGAGLVICLSLMLRVNGTRRKRGRGLFEGQSRNSCFFCLGH
jgi:hypothetical protein